jgi:hypothetical protein
MTGRRLASIAAGFLVACIAVYAGVVFGGAWFIQSLLDRADG